MSKITDEILGHADENDGIEEYDNPLPDWWLALLVITIVWAVGYAVNYHFVSDHSQVAYYEAEMEAAATRWPQDTTEAGAVALTDDNIAAGQEIFTTNCVACHGATLEGGIGPNLIDDEWIHGGEIEDIVRTVTEGVPEKGMLTWGPILGPEKVGKVAAFVYSKRLQEQ
ncbi:MAG: c-type cytochrome [Deltaproteobacteria bacterium]|nr:c-type cytochrome [Deltaproteobacteria bacterium]